MTASTKGKLLKVALESAIFLFDRLASVVKSEFINGEIIDVKSADFKSETKSDKSDNP